MSAARAPQTHATAIGNNGQTSAAANSSAQAEGSLYGLCAHVPLIKSPAVRVPPVISLPPTLHPLPPNLHDYFVYPFSLEKFVLDAAERRERVRKEELQRRAPGWSGDAGVLEPTRRQQQQQQQAGSTAAGDLLDDETTLQEDQAAAASAVGRDIDEMARMLDELGRKG